MLTRRVQESIIITVPGYPPLRVLLVDIRGKAVRIGVEAPADVRVDRQEVHEMRQEQANAG